MRTQTLQNIVIVAVVTTVVVVGGLALEQGLRLEQPEKISMEEAEQIIAEGLEHRFVGTRFDVYEAQVSQCQIRVHYHDEDACGAPHTLQTYTSFVDLRVFEIDDHIRIYPAAEGLRLAPGFTPRPRVGDESRYIIEYDEALLEEARAEIGWGWQAAVLASERLVSQYPMETLAAWREVTQCSGHSWVSADGVEIRASSHDADLLERALLHYSAHCAPQD
ncbi:hypothetical protein [uncultured Roseobacter sp.]|uniref:hypothetical protein n=1 Tax=uncultured Roseobacter sp. TaxID=114847 RepID=UPI0026071CE1|nr:hypothetical protein [uncultured Roseobacter sp.]